MLLRNAKIWLAHYDISGEMNRVALEASVDPKVNTKFGSTTRTSEAGLFMNKMSGQILVTHGADSADDAVYARIGVAGVPITVSPDGGEAGEVAYFMRALLATYAPLAGNVGDLLAAQFAAEGDGGYRMPRGFVSVAAGSRTASFDSTGIQLGAVGASQRLFAAIHVLSASASDTLDVIVQSDNANNFPSPTTRLTFTQATGKTSEFLSAAGAITDDWFRMAVTIGGASPDFSFVGVIGVV